jgi:hypothetical protein
MFKIMKSNKCIFKKSVSLLALTVMVAFSLKACSNNKVEYPEGSIIMTTTAKELLIALSGSDDIAIHWGDGKKSNLNEGDPLDLPGGYVFSHTYSTTTKRTVYITGKVETLRCDNMQLTALDVSQNVELKNLDCHNNQLTKLDVSRNIALKTLFCYNNRLTALDVTKNIAIEELHIEGNQVSTLDVSQNIALKDLRCSNNQIANIDVSANPRLEILNLNRNQLTKLDLNKNTSLIELCIGGNQFTASALNDVFKTLRYIPELEYGFIDYTLNPGSTDADHSIWKEKNWLFQTCR